jgi:hypothetical protein
MNNPVARYYDTLTDLGGMDQFSFPLPGSFQFRVDLAPRTRKLGLKEEMRILPQRFLTRITVKLLAASIPNLNSVIGIHYEYMRQIENLGLLPKLDCLSLELPFEKLVIRNVGNGKYDLINLVFEGPIWGQSGEIPLPIATTDFVFYWLKGPQHVFASS